MKRIFPILALALLLIILVFPVSATESAASNDTYSLWLKINDHVYEFVYPANVTSWDDFFLLGYDQPGLGRCSFGEYGGSIALCVLSTDEFGNPQEFFYFLVDSAGFSVTTKNSLFLFTLSKETTPFEVSTVCTGKHDLRASSEIEAYCGGYEAKFKCAVCSYVETLVFPPGFYPHKFESKYLVPTCTESGYHYFVCTVCSFVKSYEVYDALGHDFPVVGACRREGCDEYTGKNLVDGAGNLWNGVTGWVGGLFDGESSEGESSDDDDIFLDKILKFLTREPAGDPFLDGVDAIIKLFAIALPVLVFFFLWPILKPVVEFFGDVFRAGFKATSSGVKSFAKWVKSKKKRKKKK